MENYNCEKSDKRESSFLITFELFDSEIFFYNFQLMTRNPMESAMEKLQSDFECLRIIFE